MSSRKLLDALASVSDHGPRVDVTLDGVGHTVLVPLRSSGLSNVAESVFTFASGGPFARAPTQPLAVLSDISAVFPAGTATLILGNSGGGKTALLGAIAGREAPSAPSFGTAIVPKLAALAPMCVREAYAAAAPDMSVPALLTAAESPSTCDERSGDRVVAASTSSPTSASAPVAPDDDY